MPIVGDSVASTNAFVFLGWFFAENDSRSRDVRKASNVTSNTPRIYGVSATRTRRKHFEKAVGIISRPFQRRKIFPHTPHRALEEMLLSTTIESQRIASGGM